MSKSVKRVEAAIESLNLDTQVEFMPDTTRTAEEAAAACNSTVGQIVKSMVFEGAESGDLKLILVSGAHNLNMSIAASTFGEDLVRADPKRVRAETGFAIGGVSPIGHMCQLETWIDADLLQYDVVWAAAGTPSAVFSASPQKLLDATKAKPFANSKQA